MLTAQEIMTKEAPILSFDKTVEDAISFLRSSPTNFVAISAGVDRLHGVITEACLMKIFLRYQANLNNESLILYRDLFEPAQLIHGREPFTEVVKKIGTAVGNRGFVIDDKGAIIGYITAKNILSVMIRSQGSAGKSLPVESHMYLYENFFTKSPFMMHSANSQGVIQMANEMLHAVLGYKYGELIGKTIYDLYTKEHHKKAESGLQTILDKGYHKVIESQMLHKDGTVVDIELVSRALQDQKQESIGTITVSRPLDMAYLIKVLPQID